MHNTASGVAGGLVQAGVVHGGVHLHQPPPDPVVPRQLPAAPGLFTGRAAELARLDQALDATASVRVSAIGGAGGVGKTWLALAWAHRHLDRFPDGQLFADLHGFSPAGEPVDPAVALRGFLDALAVDPGRIPAGVDAQAALYRSLVAGRRMLVVLDNAADSAQVVPLLPGSPTCTVLVTGRRRLASLIDRHGAGHLSLGVLTDAEAHALLAARLGADRLAAEPRAVAELVGLCGGHPLALSIIARGGTAHPGLPLAEIAAEARELGLAVLDHDSDPSASLPTVLSWSLRRLTDEQRTLFALLGIAPGPDLGQPAVLALAGTPSARTALSALEEASLVERRPGSRYEMHDLVRGFARTTADTTLPEPTRQAALTRLVDFAVHTAHGADRLLNPHRQEVRPGEAAPGVRPQVLPDAEAALAWFSAEHATLLATQQAAATAGLHHQAWHLAWALETFYYRRGHRRDALASWRIAVAAAAHLSDAAAVSRTHRFLGRACSRADRHEEGIEHLEHALALAEARGDRTEQAHTHRVLATVWEESGNLRRALEHGQQALARYRALGQPTGVPETLNMVGWYHALLGEFDTARDHCLAAATLHRRNGNTTAESAALDSLGFIAHRTGDHQQAVDHYRHALALRRALGHTGQIAGTLDRMGHPHLALGQPDEARTAWSAALELYRDQGRAEDAARVRRQLDGLGSPGETT
ncbi:tetratricopeptide (TPR) repeat protein [Crossiella equi]|uniref:Tetratricopeptide (TPR) repeat protein n=1 Tax=Crossiella equi TaxID=130796 RepID=A0ABS5ARP7_9PSEU|nr:tetratricopeptide repeat protein [Crossiella equi]MBP2479257.1 tetratricopeptide (TPR) repeat protein [Crossiella equi]